MAKIILFYGSFDPIHAGHLKIAKNSLNLIKGDKLYFGLNKNSNSKNLAPFLKRKRMVELVVKKEKKFGILDIKFDYNNLEETYDKILSFCNKDDEYYILIGEDQILNLNKWYKFNMLKKHFKFIVARRGNSDYDINSDYIYLDNKVCNISSSEIKKGKYTHLDKDVKKYIINNNLYLTKQIKKYISSKRYKHVVSVKNLALKIYKNNKDGLDRNKVITASLLHDIAKEYPKNKTMMIMNKYYPSKVKENESLYHQYVGEYLARKKFGIEDTEILEAIKYHTTANANMSKLAKLVYVSDKLDPLRSYDSSAMINACINNLDKGFIEVLKENIDYLNTKHIPYRNEYTINAVKYYLK